MPGKRQTKDNPGKNIELQPPLKTLTGHPEPPLLDQATKPSDPTGTVDIDAICRLSIELSNLIPIPHYDTDKAPYATREWKYYLYGLTQCLAANNPPVTTDTSTQTTPPITPKSNSFSTNTDPPTDTPRAHICGGSN
ncbi:hypothetical protein BGX38DRAFT_1259493 [Terfezia claveryi]|nr:hypothetical protein BGX38DRAFT_1259493 [Terfezia claveryi]